MDRKSVADAVAKAWDNMDVNMMSSLVSDDFRLYSVAVKKLWLGVEGHILGICKVSLII